MNVNLKKPYLNLANIKITRLFQNSNTNYNKREYAGYIKLSSMDLEGFYMEKGKPVRTRNENQ